MELLNDLPSWITVFLEWAWARHHNVLSWYIRPLFFIPFCYFAYRRSGRSIALTLIALMTSMFWFPAPAQPSPEVIAMLEAERVYLTGAWPWWKVFLSLLTPVGFWLLGLAFWKRSLWYGLAVINAMLLIKIAWTFAVADTGGALAHLVPALGGLIVVDVVMVLAIHWYARRPAAPLPASAS